eukprot:2843784-Rhodomonas_salina.1
MIAWQPIASYQEHHTPTLCQYRTSCRFIGTISTRRRVGAYATSGASHTYAMSVPTRQPHPMVQYREALHTIRQ